MHVPETIPAGNYPVEVKSSDASTEITITDGPLKGETIKLTPMGTTKRPHEESKKKRKAAAKSRKINRKR